MKRGSAPETNNFISFASPYAFMPCKSFGGMKYRKSGSARSKIAADEKKFAAMRRGNNVRVEQEGRRQWTIYARKKR